MKARIVAPVLSVLLAVTVVGCGGGSGSSGQPDAPVQPVQPPASEPLHKTGAVGCYHAAFAGVDQSLFGCGPIEFADPGADRYYRDQARIVPDFFEQDEPNWLFDECSREQANAYAVGPPSGFVLIGWHLLDSSSRWAQTDWRVTLSSVMAHEYAHQLQYRYGWRYRSERTARRMELEADFLAGVYIRFYARTRWAWRQFIRTLESVGDFNFNSPGHHGTPAQRCRAGVMGIIRAELILRDGLPNDWRSIHDDYNEAYTDGVILYDRDGLLSEVCGQLNAFGDQAVAHQPTVVADHDADRAMSLAPYTSERL